MKNTPRGSFTNETTAVIEVAQTAGRRLLSLFDQRDTLEKEVKGAQDLVTQADEEAEKIIKDELSKRFPGMDVVSEESDFDKEHASGDYTKTWIIDPLDGTRNFSIGNPNFVVSIGYVDQNGEFSGVVFYPIMDDWYIADQGRSYLNEREISVSQTADLSDAVIAFWDKREKDPKWDKPDILNALRGKVKVLRMFGASALEKAWVASGQVDLYIGNSSSIFGAVAGVALVRNAGGVALNLEGKEWKLGDIGIICGNEELVKKALEML